MRGAWIGFSWGHTQAHLFRAVLESVACEYAFYLKILKALLPDLALLETRAVGGGARSAAWNQIKADVLGVPYQRLQRAEFGTWGSALIAGKAAGLFGDLAEAAALHAQPAGNPLQPNPACREVYDRLIERYIEAQDMLYTYFREK